LSEVESELSRLVAQTRGDQEAPLQRACMSNLVIYCNTPEIAEHIRQVLPTVLALHPARALLLIGEPGGNPEPLAAELGVWSQPGSAGHRTCSEQVTLRAGGAAIDDLPYAVRELLIGDLPTNLWWAAPEPPALAGHLVHDLAEQAQQVIYDSIGWKQPARGVAATGPWLAKVERLEGQGRWRVASDLNWRRLKYWRRLLAQTLDPNTLPGALESVTEVQVEHGPHAVVQAWLLVSWLVSRLGWRVQAAKVQPGVEIAWQAIARHGSLRLRLDRLAEGPSGVRRVRIACTVDGQRTALSITADDHRRLAASFEGKTTATRTIIVQPQPLAELVGRQLTDREHDAVFRQGAAVAQVLAQSVLG
jgi:glucose-6-phosphate dehydrogenase assembly protein OpcA